jgi:hypothetical protein
MEGAGHELGHVRNRDILISSIAATIAGAITYFAEIARWGMIFGGYERDRDGRGGGGFALSYADPGSDCRHAGSARCLTISLDIRPTKPAPTHPETPHVPCQHWAALTPLKRLPLQATHPLRIFSLFSRSSV